MSVRIEQQSTTALSSLPPRGGELHSCRGQVPNICPTFAFCFSNAKVLHLLKFGGGGNNVRGPKERSPRGDCNSGGDQHPTEGPTASSRLRHEQTVVEAQGSLQLPKFGRVLIAGQRPKESNFPTPPFLSSEPMCHCCCCCFC